MTGVEELLARIPPPEHQPAWNTAEWDAVERCLGLRLPVDYRDIVSRYGHGVFEDIFGYRIWILNPLSSRYLEIILSGCADMRNYRRLPRQQVAYGVFPDRPGWLPVGNIEDGPDIWWITEGEPEQWPLLLTDACARSFQQIHLPLSAFLARFLTGRLSARFRSRMGVDPEYGVPRFVPVIPRSSSKWGIACDQYAWVANKLRNEQRSYRPTEVVWFPPDPMGRPTGARVILRPTQESFDSKPGDIYPRPQNLIAASPCQAYPPWWPELPHPVKRWRRANFLPWLTEPPPPSPLANVFAATAMEVQLIQAHQLAAEGYLSLGEHVVWQIELVYRDGVTQHDPGWMLASAGVLVLDSMLADGHPKKIIQQPKVVPFRPLPNLRG